jgi:predicted nucleic acid-binding protein
VSATVVYVDSSALLKLVFEEAETPALVEFLRRWPERVSSALACVEVRRVVGRVQDPIADREARRVLRGLDLIRIDDAIVEAAAAIAPRRLRSLDAIHLATAQTLGAELAGMVVYDGRLAASAREHHIKVFSPR